MTKRRRSTIRWLAISALALAAGPARAHDEPDRKPPSTQEAEQRRAPGGAVSPDADDPPAQARGPAGDDPSMGGSRSSGEVHPGDAFGAASPEIEEPAAARKDDAVARQRRDWLESIWSSP
jgi:hypothetical protein